MAVLHLGDALVVLPGFRSLLRVRVALVLIRGAISSILVTHLALAPTLMPALFHPRVVHDHVVAAVLAPLPGLLWSHLVVELLPVGVSVALRVLQQRLRAPLRAAPAAPVLVLVVRARVVVRVPLLLLRVALLRAHAVVGVPVALVAVTLVVVVRLLAAIAVVVVVAVLLALVAVRAIVAVPLLAAGHVAIAAVVAGHLLTALHVAIAVVVVLGLLALVARAVVVAVHLLAALHVAITYVVAVAALGAVAVVVSARVFAAFVCDLDLPVLLTVEVRVWHLLAAHVAVHRHVRLPHGLLVAGGVAQVAHLHGHGHAIAIVR